jgi:hypothetical protein
VPPALSRAKAASCERCSRLGFRLARAAGSIRRKYILFIGLHISRKGRLLTPLDTCQFYPTMPEDLAKKFGGDGLNPSWFAANGSTSMPPAPTGNSHAVPGNGVTNGRLPPPHASPPPIPPRRNLSSHMLSFEDPGGQGLVSARTMATVMYADSKERSMAGIVYPAFPPNAADGSMLFPIFPTRKTPSAAQAEPQTGSVTITRQPQAAISMNQPEPFEPLTWTNGDMSQC